MSTIKVNCQNLEISNNNKICIIAGPCQLETEQHAMDIAGKIKENTSKFQLEPLKFRGGKSQDNSAMKINISDSSIFKIEILEELSANNFLSFDISNERDYE